MCELALSRCLSSSRTDSGTRLPSNPAYWRYLRYAQVQAEQSGCEELINFAAWLRQDEAAVRAALTTPWSNGPVEVR